MTMKFWGGFFTSAVLAVGLVEGKPLVKGLAGKHPLTLGQTGKVLVGELRCAACHEGISTEGMKAAPDLSEVGTRVSGDYLKRYLADPHGVHAGTTMPDVLGGLSAGEKSAVSESISDYLSSLKGEGEKAEVKLGDPKLGREVFHEVGCVACHGAGDAEEVASLGHVSGKYHLGELSKFLSDPLKVRPSGRMPNMNLSSVETAALEAYLGVKRKEVATKPTADQVKVGKANFEKFNCVACHEMGEAKAQEGPALGTMDFGKGCMTGKVADYDLDEGQKGAIQAYLEKPVTLSDADRVKVHLTQMNCISCHVRDDFGGLDEGMEAYFHTTEEGLGNEARIPPPLTLVGGKLKPEWMNKVLYDGLAIRPYMKTRMPQFGRVALEGLPELLAKVDVVPEVELAKPTREEGPMVKNGGHLLLGVDGLNCIACHNYNGKEGPGFKGLDLITTFQRLQPGWFYEFMKDPAAHRPGIIMPNYWPGGKAVQPDILGGDTHEQLRALWYQFSLGRSARDPKGLSSKPNRLVVTDRVRVYRGRSRIAGFRGIAVGFPGGMNYAFSAQNGALTGIWKGEYVTANWRSQGAGDFNPAERAVELAQDVGFLQLRDEEEAWPLSPVTSKEVPVNPDPLYPKDRGYAFKGYFFEKDGTPTLMYECGEVAILDRSVVEGDVLKRTFTLTSEKDGLLFFRALTGKVVEKPAGVFVNGKLKVGTGKAETLMRSFGDEGAKEILVKMPVKKGETTYTIDYELVR